MQVQGADKGYTNEAAPLYWEYLTKRTLSKMGYRFGTADLDCFTADAFVVIDEEIEKRKAKEAQRAHQKANRGRG